MSIARGALLGLLATAAVACQSTGPELSSEEYMARAMELGAPGEGHQRLEPIIGKFVCTMTLWEEPGAEPSVAPGTAENSWILDGRYVHQEYHSDFEGMPFHGIGTTGYNNATGHYQGTWIDNFSTHMTAPSTGEWDEAKKTLCSHRCYTDPVTGVEVESRDVLRIVSNDEHHFEMYETRPGEDEVKLFEIVYTRTN